MTELTLRDGMVIVGSLLILAVIIDAWRRMRQQQRSNVRLKLASDLPEDLPDDISLYRELPNGGARVIDRGERNADWSDDAENDVARAPLHGEDPPTSGDLKPADSPGEAEVAASTGAAAANTSASSNSTSATKSRKSTKGTRKPSKPRKSAGSGASPATAQDSGEERIQSAQSAGEDAVSEEQASELSAADDDSVLSGVRANDDEPANLDWLEDLPDASDDDPDDSGGELPRDPDTEVIVLHVTARDERGFAGKDILEILLACDLRFGDMNFFHRHEQQAGRGPIQFSVANMLQPGVFDIDKMDAMHTRGLVFFLTLPGPEDMSQAYEYMLETARAVAKNLSGDVLDESRSVLTQQSIEHSRQQIRELERRLLAARE